MAEESFHERRAEQLDRCLQGNTAWSGGRQERPSLRSRSRKGEPCIELPTYHVSLIDVKGVGKDVGKLIVCYLERQNMPPAEQMIIRKCKRRRKTEYAFEVIGKYTAWCYGIVLRHDATAWCYGMVPPHSWIGKTKKSTKQQKTRVI